MSDQGFKAGEHSHPKGRRKRMNGVIHFGAILLYKIPEVQNKNRFHPALFVKNLTKSDLFFF